MLNRKSSLNNAQKPISEQRTRRASISTNPLMHKIKPFFNGSKNEDVPEYHNRVRYIRESCKVFSDLYKSDKDFSNKSIDNDISKAFKEFRTGDIACAYRSPSLLNTTIDDLVSIHEYIDGKRRDRLEKFRELAEAAREKQLSIRQSMSEVRDNYERTVRKLEAAESNLKKFHNRSDRSTVQNFDDRLRELEETRSDCEQARSIARDIYTAETYRIANEEHSITQDIFTQYLFDEQNFYNDIQQYLSSLVPEIQHRLDDDKLAPSFHCDIAEHCLKRIQRPIAYPISTCIRLLQNSLQEEGLFRLASAHNKQKRFVAELDLQMIDEKMKLQDLSYDAHVAANALKQYLRELPECLLTEALFSQWIEIPSLSTDEARIQRIGQLISQLPKVNNDNLCYVIRFLNRVAEHSSVNKMTPTNLAICIGCSLLYPKDQASNSFTKSSIIIELMIVHHKQFFPADNQSDLRTSYRSQPDLIPTGIPPKSQSNSNENLLDMDFPQPSPKPSGKHRPAPPPPVPQELLIQIEPTNFLPERPTAPGSPSSNNSVEKDHRSSGNIGAILDRIPYRRRRSSASIRDFSSKEDIDLLSMSPASNDGVNTLKSITDFNNRFANSNDIGISLRPDNLPSSPGEITQF